MLCMGKGGSSSAFLTVVVRIPRETTVILVIIVEITEIIFRAV
jgi:hypothetical protein